MPTGSSIWSQASHLLKYDSTLGPFAGTVMVVDDNTLSVDGKLIKIVSSRDPLQLPWKEMGIDLVIEGTGVFIDSKGAGKHIEVRSLMVANEYRKDSLVQLGTLGCFCISSHDALVQ